MRGVIAGSGGAITVASGPNLWTLTGNNLYPTTLSNVVLTGIASSDLSVSNGSIISSATIACVSAAANASVLGFGVDGTAGFWNSTHTGTGANLPMAWRMSGVEMMRLGVSGTLLVGFTSSDLGVGQGNIFSKVVAVITATVNTSYLMFSIQGSTAQINSNRSGTGTFLPITFLTSGVEAERITANGAALFGFVSSDSPITQTTGVVQTFGSFSVINGTNTSGALTNTQVMSWSVDSAFGAHFDSGHGGTGVTQPFTWRFDFTTEAMRLVSGPRLLLGASSTDFFTSNGQFAAIGSTAALGLATAATNASVFYMQIDPGSRVRLTSSHSGSGTTLPFAWLADATSIMTLSTGGNLAVTGTVTGTQLISTVATGTAPLSVASTTVVPNLSINASNSITSDASNCQYKWDHLSTGSGVWTQTGNFIYPSTTSTTNVIAGITSTDVTLTGGEVVSDAGFLCVTAATNASWVTLSNSTSTFGGGSIFNSAHSGTGTTQPFIWAIDTVEKLRLTQAGILFHGLSSSDIGWTAPTIVVNGGVGTGIAIVTGATNASAFYMQIQSSICIFQSTHSGTGTTFPYSFQIDGSEKVRIATGGQLLIARTSVDGTAAMLQVSGAGSSPSISAVGANASIWLSDGANNAVLLAGPYAGTVYVGGTAYGICDDASAFTTSSGTKHIRRGLITFN